MIKRKIKVEGWAERLKSGNLNVQTEFGFYYTWYNERLLVDKDFHHLDPGDYCLICNPCKKIWDLKKYEKRQIASCSQFPDIWQWNDALEGWISISDVDDVAEADLEFVD